MRAKIQTEPTDEPISLVEAFIQLRKYTPDSSPSADPDAPYVEALITAARRLVESITGRAMITQTWKYWLDRFPMSDEISLPFAPLQSLTSLTYTDVDSNSDTLTEGTEITVDTDSEPGRIVLDYDEIWPTDALHPNNPIEIEFVCGYASASAIPVELKHAMKLLIAQWYDSRMPVGEANDLLPLGFHELVSSYRMWTY